LFFWGHQPLKSGEISASCFSQWWEQSFIVDGINYKTAEHYMMVQKALLFGDNSSFQRIIQAKTAAEAKKIGREVKNFDETLWDSKRSEIVFKGNYHKFSQDERLKTFLLQTNDRILVEASPYDVIWGIGLTAQDENAQKPANWKGLNLLGFVLMEVRDKLASL
jgi:ribA/ribD-fused uncharacterized protein